MLQELLPFISNFAYLIASILFIVGIKRLGKTKTARQGNTLSAMGMLIAIVVTLIDNRVFNYIEIMGVMVAGGLFGAYYSKKVPMTAMPQMVAIFNGFGGIGSLLVALSEKLRLVSSPDVMAKEFASATDQNIAIITILLSILIGGVTFTGSLIAYGKLQGIVTGRAVTFKGQHFVNFLLFAAAIGVSIGLVMQPDSVLLISAFVGLALILGILTVIPIGGADMPVVISLLNSYSGMAACTTGFILENNVLIITGALVGASGMILTNIMCKGMNRSLINVLLGGFGQTTSAAVAGDAKALVIKEVAAEEAAMIFDGASSVIVVPGYGMAVAQAQHVIREFAEMLQKKGISVKYAIHPVAGRMPGHMNVLLAEANVPYDQLIEMDDINPEFENTDIALVIGANDVTNPAARYDKSSPIYGMPILNVDKARTIIVSKRSMNPGYAGIENELYGNANCLMLFGDAKKSMNEVVNELKELS